MEAEELNGIDELVQEQGIEKENPRAYEAPCIGVLPGSLYVLNRIIIVLILCARIQT